MSNNKHEGWELIINSVKAPLGFFVLIALILDVFLGGAAALSNDKIPFSWPFGLLALLILIVSLIAWQKPQSLYHPTDWIWLTVNLSFLGGEIPDDIDADKSFVEIRGSQNRVKRMNPNCKLGNGGWYFRLNAFDVIPNDSVRIELTEKPQGSWKVKPFELYAIDKVAYKKFKE